MEFHPQKCSVLQITRSHNLKYKQYTLHGHILVKKDNAKYIGVVINKTLSWNNHINDVTKKAKASLGFLQRNLRIDQEKLKTSAYFTLVRPQLEYATAVWDPYTQTYKNKIEMVQRRAARYVCNNYNREASVSTMIKHLHWRSLQQRRTNIRLVVFYKTLHGIIALDLFPQLIPVVRHTHSEAFQLPIITKQFIQYNFLPRTIANWNNLPANAATAPSLEIFRQKISSLQH